VGFCVDSVPWDVRSVTWRWNVGLILWRLLAAIRMLMSSTSFARGIVLIGDAPSYRVTAPGSLFLRLAGATGPAG
jgi:hypothetical protein